MAIAPEEGITPAEARAATEAARKATAAQNAADETARIAESDARLRARIAPAPSVPEVPVVPETPKKDTGIPATNDRTQPPGEARKGYKWRWVSMSKTNNPYGGEWREEWAGGTGDGGDTGTGSGSKTPDTTGADLLKQQQQQERVSAFNILKDEFTKYGLGSLVEGIRKLLTDGTPASEFALKLRETPEYVARFKANEARIAAGLTALSPAEYVAMEDQYQNIMRNYGLPASYYTKDTTGKQVGFEKFLANDVSASELEDRIATAQQRVLNSNPEVLQALKQFYPDINNADILAYTLDPQNALTNIKRKVTAAEIGGAALAQGLQAQGGTAESLAGMGITKAQAQQGYTEIAGVLPRASQLSDIYNQGPYTQQTAEAEVFNTAGGAAATAKRKKLSALEQATFSGQSGVGALGRDKSLYGQSYGQQGQY